MAGKHLAEPPSICFWEEDCDRPYDQEEGRYCSNCDDYVRTCANDHCSECGADT